jgi:hypothetical protein
MSDSTGTLESLALLFAEALSPLEQDLATGNIGSLLQQLGLQLPVGFAEPVALTNAASAVATSAATLPAHVTALVNAIDNEQVPQIISEGPATLQAVEAVITAAHTFGTQLPAALSGAVPAADAEAFAGQLADRLTSYCLVRFLESSHPAVLGGLGLAGIVDRSQVANLGGTGTHLSRRLRLDRIEQVVSRPEDALRTIFGWGDPSFDGHDLLRRIADLVRGIGFELSYDEDAATPVLEMFGITLAPTTGPAPRGLVLGFRGDLAGGWSATVELGARTRLEASLDASIFAGLAVEVRPPAGLSAHPSATLQGRARVGVVKSGDAGGDLTIIALAGGVGVRARSLGLYAATDLSWDAGTGQSTGDLGLGGDLKGGRLTIDFSQADGFLNTLLGAVKVDAPFEVGFDWSVGRGLRFRGSSALEVRLPTHLALGSVAIEAVKLGVRPTGGAFPVSLSADIAARLGVIDVVVEEVGVTVAISFPADGAGNIGPIDLAFGFKPPKGAGLSVDTGVVKGGGYLRFDEPAGEYVGALELSFQGVIDLKAFGIINTKFADGRPGFAFLVLVTAEFTPIQLGFGFTLIGVGGLLSLNRTLDTPALMAGVRTGSVNSILFPRDVVANINRIASDIKSIFPLAEGHFVVAPMGKLGWGTPTLISLDIGIVLDIPVPALTIIGVLRVTIPTEEAPLLKLQVNFAGGIDFERRMIWFNASLFDSRLVGFTLTGDMALRIGWGPDPTFVLSVGGFHPAFREVPDDLRDMRRMTLALLSGNNPRLTVQTYFAVTSNTVQHGARVELYAEASGFNIYGFLGYDVLVQFNPVHFVATISAGIALRSGTSVIAGVSVRGELSGPAPWNAIGSASLELLFFEITVRFKETWGAVAAPDPVELENVTALVEEAVKDDRNWRATAPTNSTSGVSLRQVELPGGAIALQPFGVLAVSQKVVPLDFPLQKYGNKRPDKETFALTSGLARVSPQKEEFAVAEFRKMSDSEKLSAPSFERLKSGISFSTGDATATGARVTVDVEYELTYVHRSIGLILFAGLIQVFVTVFAVLAGGASAARSAMSKVRDGAGVPPAPVLIKQQDFLVVSVADLSVHEGLTASSMAEASALMAAAVTADPLLKGQVQVVAAHELVAS